MRYGRTLLVLLMVAFSATPVLAQTPIPAQDGALFLSYDVDSADPALIYCRMEGQKGSPFGGPMQVEPRVATVGASATITAVTAGTNPFNGISAGDVLLIRVPATNDPDAIQRRVVATVASMDQVTVTETITLTAAASGGNQFSWLKRRCGTAVTDGWFSIPVDAHRVALSFVYEQGDATVRVRFECRPVGGPSSIVILYPGEGSDCGLGGTLATDRCQFLAATAGTATGSLTVIDEDPQFQACRVGLSQSADPSDVGAALEKVSVYASIR